MRQKVRFPLGQWRKAFPLIWRAQHRSGHALVYLDNAASTQKPSAVFKAVREMYAKHYANVHRGVYQLAEEATLRYEQAREVVANFLGVAAREIVFLRNATEAINLVALSFAPLVLRRGDVILASEMEHHANLLPWQQAARLTGARLRFIRVNKNYQWEKGWERKIDSRVKLVAVGHISNVTGTINPLRRLAAAARRVGAYVVLDAAQSVGRLPPERYVPLADFLAFSGHKVYGPTGIGVLWGRAELLARMPPLLRGGEMVSRVTLKEASWREIPWKFEAGTPHFVGAVGLAAALNFLRGVGWRKIQQHEQHLVRVARRELRQVPGLQCYFPRRQAAVFAFNLPRVHAHDLASYLDEHGIAVRAGHHCAQPYLHALGLTACVRASAALYNTPAEIRRLAAVLHRAAAFFRVG
jgi:cysteine desulfurase/selenocysteine lyase